VIYVVALCMFQLHTVQLPLLRARKWLWWALFRAVSEKCAASQL